MKKAFIATYGGGHVNIIKMLVEKLNEYFQVNILALTVADKALSDAKIKHVTIKDYLFLYEEEEKINIRRYGEKLAIQEYNSSSGMSLDDCVAYLGVGYYDLITCGNTSELAEQMYQVQGRKVFCPVSLGKKILAFENPDIVILPTGVRFEKAIALAANKMNIPVLYIQDMPENYPEEKCIPFHANICVMNEYAKEDLISKLGIPSEFIHITGQPVFENITSIDDASVMLIRKQLRTDLYTNIITYLEEPLKTDSKRIESFLAEEALKNPQNLYVAKLHPSQDPNASIHVNVSNFLIVKEIDLKALLYISSVTITRDSTSGLEAALMNRPLITVELEEKSIVDFSKFGISVGVKSLDELSIVLNNVLKNGEEFYGLHLSRRQFQNRENAVNNICCVAEQLTE